MACMNRSKFVEISPEAPDWSGQPRLLLFLGRILRQEWVQQ